MIAASSTNVTANLALVVFIASMVFTFIIDILINELIAQFVLSAIVRAFHRCKITVLIYDNIRYFAHRKMGRRHDLTEHISAQCSPNRYDLANMIESRKIRTTNIYVERIIDIGVIDSVRIVTGVVCGSKFSGRIV